MGTWIHPLIPIKDLTPISKSPINPHYPLIHHLLHLVERPGVDFGFGFWMSSASQNSCIFWMLRWSSWLYSPCDRTYCPPYSQQDHAFKIYRNFVECLTIQLSPLITHFFEFGPSTNCSCIVCHEKWAIICLSQWNVVGGGNLSYLWENSRYFMYTQIYDFLSCQDL